MLPPLFTLTSVIAISRNRASTRPASSTLRAGYSFTSGSSEKILELNRFTLHLKYYGPAHTDSDISVAIPEADIFHCADTYWNGIYPFIDYSTGGNIDGMIKATDANVAAVTDKTIV